MKILRDNIKTMLKITDDTYDQTIDITIMQTLNQICSYCNNDFIRVNWSNGYVYKYCDMTISDDTITTTTDISIFETGDYIRLYGTDYNDGLYLVEYNTNGTMILNGKLKTETIKGYIALVDFPTQFLTIVAEHIKSNTVNDGSIKSEKVDDVTIEYNKPNNSSDFITNNASILNNYRKVYKDNFWRRLWI